LECHTTWTETEGSRLRRKDEVRIQELSKRPLNTPYEFIL